MLVAESGFLLIDKIPVLLALEAAAIVAEAVVRWRVIAHRAMLGRT